MSSVSSRVSEAPPSVKDMFEDVAADQVLSIVRAHAFDHELDLVAVSQLVDAVVALDRAVAAAQATQADCVAALLDRYGSGSGAAALATVAEVSLARTIGPTAAGSQLALGLALRDLPLIAERFRDGRLSEPVVRSVVRETAALDADDLILADDAYAEGGATVTSNGQGLCTRSHTFKHLPGFSVRAEGRTTVRRTPTGHEYRSKPPPLLGIPRSPGQLRQ